MEEGRETRVRHAKSTVFEQPKKSFYENKKNAVLKHQAKNQQMIML